MTRSHLLKTLRISVAVIVLVILIPAILITIDGLSDDLQTADVAIVLGNKVEENGLPSERLQARLDKAVELYRDSLFHDIIVSGGIGVEGFNEAEVMKRYLIEHGVPEDGIHTDEEGATTYHTAINSAQIMREHRWRSAMVISQYFHISRSRLALERCGISPVYSAHAEFFELRDLYSLLREVVGYGTYLFRSYPSP